MHRKLLTTLVAACALAAVLIGAASASAATLTLKNGLAGNAAQAYFDADSTTISMGGGFTLQCDEFSLQTDITQNQADPVTLQLSTWAGPASLSGCLNNGTPGVTYSNIQFTSPMTFNAWGAGALRLRVTENWSGAWTCVREGTLNLTYTPDLDGWDGNGDPVSFDGYLNRVSGSSMCPSSARLQGSFGGQGSSDAPTDEVGLPIDWVVTL